MKYPFLLTLLLLLPCFSQGQTTDADDPRSQFVGLNNGQRVYAKRVQIKSPLLKSNYFLLDDSIRFATEAVKYYQNEDGFFLKISDPYGRDDFAERLISGRISKYYISKTYYNNMYGPGYGLRRIWWFWRLWLGRPEPPQHLFLLQRRWPFTKLFLQ